MQKNRAKIRYLGRISQKSRYEKYLIAMNCTKDRVFEVEVPQDGVARTFPGKDVVKERKLEVQPRSTVVVVIE